MKKIFYLGPQESYSNIVSKKVFGEKQYELISCKSFLDIVNHTLSTTNSFGILPIENSITSDIHENIDFLFKNDLQIINEAFLQINLCLIGLKNTSLENIVKVYSHPRAFAQCANFLKKYSLTAIETRSTSAARDIIVNEKDKTIAAIGSKELVADDTLQIMRENIGDEQYNMTRFVFVTKENTDLISKRKNKTTIAFKVPHTPGSLAKLLTEIAKQNLNVTKIESRPIPGTKWEYQFWIDIENTNGDLDIKQLSEMLEKNTVTYKIIGIYETGKIFES